MTRLLYKEVDGNVEFRRHEDGSPELLMFLPERLRKPIPRDPTMSLDEQATKLVRATGWLGGQAYNADTYPGKAFLHKRKWEVE